MPIQLDDYQEVAGPGVIEELHVLAARVTGHRIQHINSTPVGGGVAEILTRLVPLMQELGLETRWDVIKGDHAFSASPKPFTTHCTANKKRSLDQMFEIFRENTRDELTRYRFFGDVIFVHDPQPAGLIAREKRDRPELGVALPYRCIGSPAGRLEFPAAVRGTVRCGDLFHAGFCATASVAQFRIAPSIDPLSDKNKPLDRSYVSRVLEKYHVDPGRPILTQVSRFDRFKDPLGVIDGLSHGQEALSLPIGTGRRRRAGRSGGSRSVT